jgi:hypothetical protein
MNKYPKKNPNPIIDKFKNPNHDSLFFIYLLKELASTGKASVNTDAKGGLRNAL